MIFYDQILPYNKKVSEYDQDIPKSHTARHREEEIQNIQVTRQPLENKSKATSSLPLQDEDKTGSCLWGKIIYLRNKETQQTLQVVVIIQYDASF